MSDPMNRSAASTAKVRQVPPTFDTPVARVLDLDPTVLGEMCARMLGVALQLGHSSPIQSLEYVHPTTREGQFLSDLLAGVNTQELIERYGSPAPGLHALTQSVAEK